MSAPADFCPYVGLQPYTEADRDYFFGRQREQRIIASNLYAAPLTVLYGASGVGKSSVLLAGVVPHLRTVPRTAVVCFAPGKAPHFSKRSSRSVWKRSRRRGKSRSPTMKLT